MPMNQRPLEDIDIKKEDLIRALFVLRKALEAYPGRTE